MSKGPGFTALNFTKQLSDVLYPWFHQKYAAGEAKVERPVPGGYLNDNHVPSSHLNLDFHPQQHGKIQAEMQDIIEWWCNRPLVHSATFGVRVYKTGNILLNHVDVAATHVAIAVIQVDQKVDKDQGWPLEVIT